MFHFKPFTSDDIIVKMNFVRYIFFQSSLTSLITNFFQKWTHAHYLRNCYNKNFCSTPSTPIGIELWTRLILKRLGSIWVWRHPLRSNSSELQKKQKQKYMQIASLSGISNPSFILPSVNGQLLIVDNSIRSTRMKVTFISGNIQ